MEGGSFMRKTTVDRQGGGSYILLVRVSQHLADARREVTVCESLNLGTSHYKLWET